MKYKFIIKAKKYIVLFILTLIVFSAGFFVGNKTTYKPSVYNKYYTDNKTGVQYIVMVSKDGGIAIFPRLNSDGTLYKKRSLKLCEIYKEK